MGTIAGERLCTTYSLLLTTYCSLLTTYNLLLTTGYLLLTTCYYRMPQATGSASQPRAQASAPTFSLRRDFAALPAHNARDSAIPSGNGSRARFVQQGYVTEDDARLGNRRPTNQPVPKIYMKKGTPTYCKGSDIN